jgi:hypothetical protein
MVNARNIDSENVRTDMSDNVNDCHITLRAPQRVDSIPFLAILFPMCVRICLISNLILSSAGDILTFRSLPAQKWRENSSLSPHISDSSPDATSAPPPRGLPEPPI